MTSKTEEPAELGYGKIARLYDLTLSAFGFKRGMRRFLAREIPTLPPNARILDAGCGTGFLTIYFAKKFPNAEITAFDIENRMLDILTTEKKKLGSFGSRIVIAEGDLARPGILRRYPEGFPLILAPASFDVILVSGALEHVPLLASVRQLADLLKPGGIFINLSMQKNVYGETLGWIYRFQPYTEREMEEAITAARLTDIRTKRLTMREFPVNISRIAFIARKP